jgi:hypothetical protein
MDVEWNDSVRHLTSDNLRMMIRKCGPPHRKRDAETAGLWQRIVNVAAVEASYQPAA